MIRWFGERLGRKIVEATKQAVNTTMSLAVIHAKKDHRPGAHARQRFVSRTGSLERSIQIKKFATYEGDSIVGRWGSLGLVYARRIELGFQGKDRLGRVINTKPYPYLRPAAEATYPAIARRIRKELNR